MRFLPLLFLFLETVTCLTGGTLLMARVVRSHWFAMSLVPVVFCTGLFFIETFIGLGNLRWLGAVLSVGSLAISLLHFFPKSGGGANSAPPARTSANSGLLVALLAFIGFFGYALIWRLAFPDIDRSSEKIADLAYICTYLPGSRIPSADAWLFPYLSTQYYSFQHYCAAVYGRLFGLDAGTTYNLSFCLLIGLIGTAFTGAVQSLTTKTWARCFIPFAFLVGGTGASLAVHVTELAVTPWSGMRFIGSARLDREPFGPMLNRLIGEWREMDLPGEPFSYSVYLGDFHAPLWGYYLLGLGVMSITLFPTLGRRSLVVLGACVTWCVLGNTWLLPLILATLGIWWLFNCENKVETGIFIASGALSVWILTSAYLSAFCSAASSYGVTIKWVQAGEHPPIILWLLFLAPTVGLAATATASRDFRLRQIGTASILILLLSECFFVDDIYSERFNRFNTTLKWWPWISAAVLLVVGSRLAEAAKSRVSLVLSFGIVCTTLIFGCDLARVWWTTSKPSFGQVDGGGFLRRDLFSRLMLERLRALPLGVVIERPKPESFTNSACLPLLAGHKMWLGWVGHEQLWRGYRDDIAQRQQRLADFFNGDLDNAGQWARGQGIDYVLWYQNGDDEALWQRLNSKLTGFTWEEIFRRPDGKRVGLWRVAGRPSGML